MTIDMEKKLEKSDIPEVVICMDPGLNNVTLNNHGYHSSSYSRGALQPESIQFVGWNGRNNETKSSHEMLEEALLLPNRSELIIFAGYGKDFAHGEKSVLSFKNSVFIILDFRFQIMDPHLVLPEQLPPYCIFY